MVTDETWAQIRASIGIYPNRRFFTSGIENADSARESEVIWTDQFGDDTDAPWKNDQLIGLDFIPKKSAPVHAGKADGPDGTTGETCSDGSGPGTGPGPGPDTGTDSGTKDPKDTGYHSTKRQPGTKNAILAVGFEGHDCTVQVSPKIDDVALRLKVLKELRIASDILYTACVFDGLGEAYAYQNGDAVVMFRNSQQRNEAIRNACTTTTLSSAPLVQPKASTRKGQSKVQKDWIAELIGRQAFEQDPRKLWHHIDREKMIHVVTDGGAPPIQAQRDGAQ
jgi:hypothetical protein